MEELFFGFFWFSRNGKKTKKKNYNFVNLLSVITPLGDDTKVWAIVGMPLGFNTISVIGFALMSVGVTFIKNFLHGF